MSLTCLDCGKKLRAGRDAREYFGDFPLCAQCHAARIIAPTHPVGRRLIFGDDSPRRTAMRKLSGPEIPTDWRPVPDPEATA